MALRKSFFLFLPILFLTNWCFSQTNETADFSSLRILSAGNDGAMQAFALSRDQRYLAIANEHKVIKIFDGHTGKFIKRISGYQEHVVEISILPSGKILTAGFDNSLALLSIEEGKVIGTLSFPNEGGSGVAPVKLRSMDVNETGTEAVAGDNKGHVYFIDLIRMTLLDKKIKIDAPQVSCVRYSRDYKTIAVGTGVAIGYMLKKHPILLLDATTKEIKTTLPGDVGATTALCFSYDGNFLYSGHKSNKRNIRIWDLRTGISRELKAYVSFISNSGYTDLNLDKENKIVIATTDDNSVEIYDMQTGSPITSKSRSKVRLLRKLDHFPKVIYPLNEGSNFIVGGFNQNLLYLFNREKRGVTGYFHSFNNEWAVVAADGRMDGSQEAIKNLVWQEGNSSIPLEQTFERAYTPKLLTQLIGETTVQNEFKVSQAASALPELKIISVHGQNLEEPTRGAAHPKISTHDKNIQVEVSITSHADQVNEIMLYQNAKLVATQPAQGTAHTFNIILTDAFGSNNYFTVSARTKSGIDTEKKQFIVDYQGKTNDKPNLYLFTIGINQYKNPKYNLNYGVADANEFEATVTAGAGSLFDKIIPIHLRDGQAVKKNIMVEFDKLKNEAKEQDMFIFYYAGHGVMNEGPDAEFNLIPYDVTQLYGRDDMLKEKAIPASYLKEISKNINAQKQVFILDACQSAGALEAVASRGAVEEKAIAQLARSTGTFWITASGSEQFATEFKDLGHGIFTYSLIEGMKGKAANNENRITVKGLSAYVEERVPELSEKYKGTAQYPSGYSFGNDFPIAVVKQKQD
ncbi:MAG: caspase family protein [Bacteroidetes bacterium]|nr:caspase family protein [Bacteroidota bacterium]